MKAYIIMLSSSKYSFLSAVAGSSTSLKHVNKYLLMSFKYILSVNIIPS